MAGELAIPDSVTTIGASAFSGCKKITEVTLPKALTCIDEFTFNGCIALAEIDLPDTVTAIQDDAFKGCPNVVFYCEENSYAKQYAETHGFPVVVMELE